MKLVNINNNVEFISYFNLLELPIYVQIVEICY